MHYFRRFRPASSCRTNPREDPGAGSSQKKTSKGFSCKHIQPLLASLLILSLLTQSVTPLLAATSPWSQTDWSGGSGQVSWSDSTKFDTSAEISTIVSGEVSLQNTSDWFDSSWAYRRQITFDNSAQAENLVDFPVLVKLNPNRINYSNTQNSGQDIRFTDADGTTQLSHEIETWNEAGDSFLWVKVPQIDASSDSDYIYMYYGNASVGDGQNSSSVWNNTIARYHLGETTLSAGSPISDSSANAASLAVHTSATTTTGQSNGAMQFSGASGSFLQHSAMTSYPVFNAATVVDAEAAIASTSATLKLSQSFQVSTEQNIGGIQLPMKRLGTPTVTYLKAEIQTDNSGVPSGETVPNGITNCHVMNGAASYSSFGFAFNNAPTISPNVPYHIVLTGYTNSTCTSQKSTPEAAGNYIAWGYDASSPTYGLGSLSTFDGSTWTQSPGYDFSFGIFDNTFNITTNFSLGTWFKTTNTDTRMLLQKADRQGGNWFGNQSFRLTVYSGKLYFSIQPGTTIELASNVTTSTFADGNWHHVVVTYDGSTKRLFFDGTLDSSLVNSANLSLVGAPFAIAEARGLNTNNFNGSMDEVFVDNVAHSSAWIAAQYKSESDSFNTFATEEQYHPFSGVLTSSIFDTQQANDWEELTFNATTPSSTSLTVKVRTSNNADMNGATDFASCDAIASGTDISANNCATDGHRYIQYQVALSTSNPLVTPTFQDVSVAFSVSDSDAPAIALNQFSSPTTDTTPTFGGTATEAIGTVASVEFQVDSTAGAWSVCTADDGAFDEAQEAFSCTPPTLSQASHTVYFRATDNEGNVTASDSESSKTFVVDLTAPQEVELISPGNNHASNNERPTFTFKPATDAASGINRYKLVVDNPGDTGFTLDSIAPERSEPDTQPRYTVTYEGFGDDRADNDRIYITTKSSSAWGLSDNDGKLTEGIVTWSIVAVDNAGNERITSHRYVLDRTNPRLSVDTLGSTSITSSYMATSDVTPTIKGTLTDPLAGVDTSQAQSEHGPKVSSGPRSVEVQIEKRLNFTYQPHLVYTLTLDDSWWSCDQTAITDNTKHTCEKYAPFALTPPQALSQGSYRVTLTGMDTATNRSTQSQLTLDIVPYTTLTTTEEQAVIEETIAHQAPELTPEAVEEIKQELEIALPTDAPLTREVADTGASVITSTVQALGNAAKTIVTTTGNALTTVAKATTTMMVNRVKFVAHVATTIVETSTKAVSQLARGIYADSTRQLAFITRTITNTYGFISSNAPGFARSTLQAFGGRVQTVADKAVAMGSATQARVAAVTQTANQVTKAGSETLANASFALGERAQDISDTVGLAIIKASYNLVTEPTTIANVQAMPVSPTSVKITWITNHPANGKVNWGFASGQYAFEAQTSKRTTYHEFTLENLEPGTNYHYEVMSQNKNYVYDANREFQTPPAK
jgi:hypothetical protein